MPFEVFLNRTNLIHRLPVSSGPRHMVFPSPGMRGDAEKAASRLLVRLCTSVVK